MSSRNKRLRWLLLVTVTLVAGWWLPGALIGNGVERFADPAHRVVAGEAVDIVGAVCLGNPASRVFARALRVYKVETASGSCTVGPAPADGTADMQATVRAYGPFGIPIRSVTATCGGTYVAC
ncbi:hypothetical protein [Longimicrobium sp.]|uniref:hypothetical protein n=1 Tax=Longimicrobium sp. TaxID=2029185 RepID=UPI002ED89199